MRTKQLAPMHLRSPDDPQGGGPTAPTNTGVDSAGEAAPQQPSYVTEEMFRTSMQEMQNALFGMTRKMVGDLTKKLTAAPAPQQQTTARTDTSDQTPAPDAELARRMDALETDRRFDQAVQGLNLRGRKRDLARDMFAKDAPADVEGWVKEISDVFGLKPETPASPAQEPSRPGAGAPSPTRTGTAPTKLLDWTRADLESAMRAKGLNPKDMNNMANKQFFKELTTRLLDEAQDVRFELVERK